MPKEIQQAAGHKTITMAASYSHRSPAHKLSMVERIVRTATKTCTKRKRPPVEGGRFFCRRL
jgi:hypothetical protein